MSSRARIALLAAISALALAVIAVFGIGAYLRAQEAANAPSEVPATPSADFASGAFAGAHIEFRNTAAGQGYGVVAAVPLDDPDGTRTLSSTSCDRVDATREVRMCLRTDAGVVTTWVAVQTAADGTPQQEWGIPGVPSRTRVSANSHLVAETAFVTGESYATVGFSVATVVSKVGGETYGSLEDFALFVDGQRILAADRNVWGVTFADDDRHFYATAASAGKTWLVEGDLVERTLTAVHETAECPSLSPDGTRVAFKENLGDFTQPDWRIVVYDLATGDITPLAETRSVDDQVEWLDDATILYGLPRQDAIGDSDVWAAAADGSGEPSILIPHAWSPSVVR